MDLMTRFGADASFLGQDGYHHHIGANTWASRGPPREPARRAGAGGGCGLRDAELAGASTPDGIPVATERRRRGGSGPAMAEPSRFVIGAGPLLGVRSAGLVFNARYLEYFDIG